MDDATGKWCIYVWIGMVDEDAVHPDDLAVMLTLAGTRVYYCLAVGEYVLLQYGPKQVRVKPKYGTPHVVPEPPRKIGEEVVVVRKGMRRKAIVEDIVWHHRRCEPFFLVSIDGKRQKKRYWEEDFLPPDPLGSC